FLRSIASPTAAGHATAALDLFASTLPVNVTSPATVTQAYHDVYFDFNLRPYNFPPWFSSQYLTDGSTQSFTLDAPAASSATARLLVNLWSLTEEAHALQVLLNGQPAGQATWNGGSRLLQLSFDIPGGSLRSGANQIELIT